jgi:hypothetical protein
MEILRVTLVNNSPRVYCLGSTDLIPGKPESVEKHYLDHPDIAAALEDGDLKQVEEQAEQQAGAGDSAIDKMTVDELRQYAAEKGIDLGDAKVKPDIVAAIKAAQV